MKGFLIFVIIIIFNNLCLSQTEWFFRNIINQEITFLTPIDSFQNIYPIINGIVVIKDDTINLKKNHEKYYFESYVFYDDYIKSFYLYQGEINENLSIVLDFCYNKLFQITLYAKGNYYLNNIRYDCISKFNPKYYELKNRTSDSVVNYGNRIITYGERTSNLVLKGNSKFYNLFYEEDFLTDEGFLCVTDKKIIKKMPSWCGTCNGRKTWLKLKKYLDKTKPK